MSADPAAVARLASLFDSTLSNNATQRTKATEEIRAIESLPGASLVNLTLIASEQFSPQARQAAAIAFKNLIMQHWDDEITPQSRLPQQDRDAIKTHLPSLMVTAHPQIQSQLSQVLAIISKTDFPQQWPQLMPDLVAKLSTASPPQDHQLIIGCLETLHSIFHRYRHELKSDPLFAEIKYVLEQFADPLTKLFGRTFESLPSLTNDKDQLQQAFQRVNLLLEIFYSLNAQDLPAYFEDHMPQWFQPFQLLLNYSNPLLNPRDDSEPGLIDQCQSLVCDIVNLYASKYEEEFQPFVGSFVQLTWQRLVSLTTAERFDSLATTAIKFLTSVVSKPFNRSLFESDDALKAMATQIVVPQIHLRQSDIDMFDTDATEWVRRDIEGSDVDTRRRVTIDFLRQLTHVFDTRIISLVTGFVTDLLAQYAANPAQSWVKKDAAIYIILALCARASTRSAGITQLHSAIDIAAFFTSQILPELSEADINARPILKADSLKFIALLRSQLSAEHLIQLLPLCIKFLRSDSVVVHTYAAYSIEKLLTVKNDLGKPKISRESLAPVLHQLMEALFGVFDKDDSEQNEYVMQAILRVINLSGDAMLPYTQPIIAKLTTVLKRVAENPSHPQFNHHLFDAIAALIAATSASAQAMDSIAFFEKSLFPIFEQILASEHGLDFAGYCFQLLAQLLEYRGSLTPSFTAIFPSLLTPMFYEQNSTIPASVRLLQAYLRANVLDSQPQHIQPLLGIFQQLLTSRKQQALAMQLLSTLVAMTPLAIMQPYLGTVWSLVFARCQSKPGAVFLGAVDITFSVFALRHSGDALIQSFETVQAGISGPLLQSIVAPNLTFVPARGERRYERNIAIVGMSELLFKSTVWTKTSELAAQWPAVLVQVILLCDTTVPSTVTANGAEDNAEGESEALGAGGSETFARLAHAVPPSNDWSTSVTTDPINYFASSLQQWSALHPGQLMERIRATNLTGLSDAQQQATMRWLTQHGFAPQ